LDESRYQTYLADVSMFYNELRGLKKGSWVVVDEVQRLPGLLNDVHRLIEDRKLKFALTGSSARKLKMSGVNLLAGRALRKEFYPFLPSELGPDFSINKALRTGTLPLVWASSDPTATLEAYVQMYLREEVKAEALVRNLQGFARFLPVMGLFHSQIINISAIARDAGVARNTIQGFIEILEDTLMLTRLNAFQGRLRVREKRHPKAYWVDPGLARATKKNRGALAVEEKGPLFEGLVFMILQAWNAYYGLYDDIFYWSPAEAKQTEVDFVLTRGKEVIAIEVKSSTRIRKDDYKGLNAIAELEGIRRRIVVYLGGTDFTTENGIEVLTFETFLASLQKL
jgi:predicted AAA+ superfamily ATPase